MAEAIKNNGSRSKRKYDGSDRKDAEFAENLLIFQILKNKRADRWEARHIVPVPMFQGVADPTNLPTLKSYLQSREGISGVWLDAIKKMDDKTPDEQKELLTKLTESSYYVPLIINHEYAVIDTSKKNLYKSAVCFRTFNVNIEGWWSALVNLKNWHSNGVLTIKEGAPDEDGDGKLTFSRYMIDITHPKQMHPKYGKVVYIGRPLDTHRYYEAFIESIKSRVRAEKAIIPIETYVV